MNEDEKKADIQEIHTTITTLHEPDALIELCALGGDGIVSGYFDDHVALAREARRLSNSGIYHGVYITLNPVKRYVPRRRGLAKNRMYDHVEDRTKDKDIDKRRWFPLDIDPVRAPKTSATKRQKAAASWCKSWTTGSFRREWGMPDPVIADSGNGYYALYRTDEPNNQEMDELFRNATKAVAAKFSIKDVAEIDPVTHNASRLIKLFGTMTRKGPDTAKTPHRFSRLGGVPKHLHFLTREKLHQLIDALGAPKKKLHGKNSPATTVAKLEEYLNRAEIRYRPATEEPDGSLKWIIYALAMEAIVIGMLYPFRLPLGNASIQRKAFSILHNTKAFESQSGFNRRNLGVISPQHFVDSSLRHIAQRASNNLPELNMRIKGGEVKSGRRVTLIDLNPNAPLLFVPPVNEL